MDMAMETYVPFAGAQSFADVDQFKQSQAAEHEVHELTSQYQAIVQNVFADATLSLSQKTGRILTASRDLQRRLGPEVDSAIAEATNMKERGPLAKIRALFGSKADEQAAPLPAADPPSMTPGGGFRAFKDLEGKWRWLAVSSNTFVDREGEMFTKEAHELNVRTIEETGKYPDLRLWHVPGTRVGIADMLDVSSEGFVVATGTFDEGKERVAERLKELGPFGVSHGYRYREQDKVDGVFHGYMDYELSVLPLERAANTDTGFLAGQEVPEMSLSKDKKDFISNVLGVELADTLEKTLQTAAAKAAEGGVGYKELMEAVGDVAAPEVPAVDAPAAAAPAAPDIAAILREALTPLTEKVEALAAAQADQSKELAALKQSDDAKVAAIMTPRHGPGSGGFEASRDAATVADGRSADVKAAKDGSGQGPVHLREHLGMLGIPAIGQ